MENPTESRLYRKIDLILEKILSFQAISIGEIVYTSEAYSEPSQASLRRSFLRKLLPDESWKPLTIFPKSSMECV